MIDKVELMVILSPKKEKCFFSLAGNIPIWKSYQKIWRDLKAKLSLDMPILV